MTEHSLNGRIAAGRPDEADTALMEAFGRQVAAKLRDRAACEVPIRVPGHEPYKAYAPIPLVPELDPERCERCGRCALVCPVQTIDPGNYRVTDLSRCIACFACVRYCRAGARSLAEPARSAFEPENGSALRGLPSEARARDISVTARSADGRGRFGRIAFPVPWAMGPRPEERTAVRRVSACRRRSVCPLAVHGLCPAQPPFFVTNATAIPMDAGT